jgi:hypothetical protein
MELIPRHGHLSLQQVIGRFSRMHKGVNVTLFASEGCFECIKVEPIGLPNIVYIEAEFLIVAFQTDTGLGRTEVLPVGENVEMELRSLWSGEP